METNSNVLMAFNPCVAGSNPATGSRKSVHKNPTEATNPLSSS